MIILSGVLVVLAIALLVTGIVTGNTGHEVAGLDGLKLIYVSIAVSIISALCLAIGVFLRRKELFGSTEAETSAKRSAARSRTARQAKAKARVGAGGETPVLVPTATVTDVPAETSVFVVPGRKRYHLETCRQLAGREKEELTYVEAHEEGFTACTACLPDTALAARAALTETEPAPTPADTPVDDTRPTKPLSAKSLDAQADTADLTRPEDDPALVTRTDLPVTRLHDDEIEPTAESPAAAEIAETSRSGAAAEADASTDTATFDELAESLEAPSEPTERSLARSRSFFEPPDRDTATADEDQPADRGRAKDASPDEGDEDGDVARQEPSASEDTYTESHDAEADHEPSEPEHLRSSESEPSADALAESDGTISGTDTPDTDTPDTDNPDTEALDTEALDTEAPDADETATSDAEEAAEPVNEPSDDPDHDAAPSAEDETPSKDAGRGDADQEDAEHEDAADDAAERPALPYVRILSGTKRYHRPDCALIEDIADDADDLETLSAAEAKERGCTPCLVCQPDKDPSDDSY